MTKTAFALIKVFSRKVAAEVTKNDLIDAFLVDDYLEVEAKAEFAETFARIRKMKLKLERVANNFPQVKNQALHCLDMLHNERGRDRQPPESFWEMDALIRQYLYPNWGGIKGEYDARFKIIGEWFDVFISYTNRDALATNQSYARLVCYEWGCRINPADTPTNYIASTIAKYLRQNNLRSFFDYDNLKCGDVIEDEIRTLSSSSIAFVQLLEPRVFEEPTPPKKNWCNEEFKEFSNSQPPCVERAATHNRFFFVLARGDELEDILPARRPDSYSGWINEASRRLHLALNSYQDDFDALRRDVRGIAYEILDAREKIINSMLSSW